MPNIQKIEAWFHQAREITDFEQRTEFLQSCCGTNRDLFSRLSNMLVADARQHDLLDDVTRVRIDLRADNESPMDQELVSGTRLGPYRIVCTLGQGGMGTVYEAFQEHPIERKVAIKVIRAKPIDADVISRRFVLEREALSRLQHPNITTILDAGVDKAGRLFFAMELIDGDSVTDFCDQNRMQINERIRVFEQICLAIHHAHQRGILHLDIKPGNLMIQRVDGSPVPKVIDFGIAETIDAANYESLSPSAQNPVTPSESTAVNHGQLTRKGTTNGANKDSENPRPIVGTPRYMSPEQTSQDRCGLDVRSDVFSLGIVLYELIVGTSPTDGNLSEEGRAENIMEMIGRCDWSVPSSRWHSYARERAIELSHCRNESPRNIERTLNGELSTIMMKCIQNDPADRYESAAALARDLRAYLELRPLDAVESTLKYQLGKLYQRNRTLFSAATAIALLTILFAVAASVLAGNNARLRNIADRRADRLADKRNELEFANQALQSALLRANAAESEMRLVADAKRKSAAIQRAVNQYSLLMISKSRESGIEINTKSSLPRLDISNRETVSAKSGIAPDIQKLNVMGVPVVISNSSASVSTNVMPFSPSRSTPESGLTLDNYLQAVIDVFGGSIEELQPLILNELKSEFGEEHQVYRNYLDSVSTDSPSAK